MNNPVMVDIDFLHVPKNPQRSTNIEHILRMVIPDEINGTAPILETPPSVIVAKRDGTIVDGFYRWCALRLAGQEQVPVIFID